jgi:hypothetical protein
MAFISKYRSLRKHVEMPWRMRRTMIINHAAKATYRRAVSGIRMGIGFVVGLSMLEQIRGKTDVFNMIGGIPVGIMCMQINLPMHIVLRNCVIGMAFASAIVIMDTQAVNWVTDEREEKLVAFLADISPSRWLGLGSPNSSSLSERNGQKRD